MNAKGDPAETGREQEETLGRLLRLPEVLKLFPISRAAWFEGVRAGLYPRPVRIGRRAVAYRERDVRQLLAQGISQPR